MTRTEPFLAYVPPHFLKYTYRESSKGGTKHEMRHMNPFTAAGTATFPSHRFLITEHGKPDHVLETFVMKEYPENIYYYDPYHVEGDEAQTKKNLQALNDRDFANYDGWRKTLKFNQLYKAKTGRSYLANYLRKRPLHFMWPAEYFGQEHWVTTKETHIVQLPPQDQLEPVSALPKDRKLAPDAPRTLAAFRDAAQAEMNMTLRVLSCIPRVFEIPNFLSQVEVAHILKLAAGIDLKLSTTGENEFGEKKVKEDTRRTRTSYNSWVARETSPIIDVIYRRAADVLKMDEALFRDRTPDEWPDLPTRRTVAEQLQLVHYDPAQEYTGKCKQCDYYCIPFMTHNVLEFFLPFWNTFLLTHVIISFVQQLIMILVILESTIQFKTRVLRPSCFI